MSAFDQTNHRPLDGGVGPPKARRLAGPWVALLPLTYCLHFAEEYWGGESFYRWASRVARIDFTRTEFVTLNGIALVLMTLGVFAAARTRRMQWLVAAFGVAVAFNGAAHLIASVATRSYSPGLVTGVILWIPLGVYALRRSYCALSRIRFVVALGLGMVAHGVVSVVAFTAK